MNKFLLGTDIVLITRISKIISKNFCDRMLSTEEIAELNTITNKERRLHFIAGRYATKEAFFKATSNKNFKYNQLSTVLQENTLKMSLNGKLLDNVSVSISHDGDYAIAVVIICSD